MKITVISVAGKMPDWVQQGTYEFEKRLPAEISLVWKTIALAPRGKNTDILRVLAAEAKKICKAIPADNTVIALDVLGQHWDTIKLSKELLRWQGDGQGVTFLIGGPDGLHDECLQRAHQKISLSSLTMPHALVRVLLVEQIYRAWSINAKHPYHRS